MIQNTLKESYRKIKENLIDLKENLLDGTNASNTQVMMILNYYKICLSCIIKNSLKQVSFQSLKQMVVEQVINYQTGGDVKHVRQSATTTND